MRVKKSIEKIIAIITILMISSFLIPNYSQAIDSKLAKPLQAFVCFLGDSIENGFQRFFVGDKAVEETSKNKIDVNIKYSVVNIVSNNIPILDVNFFSGGESIKTTIEKPNVKYLKNIYKKVKSDLFKYIEDYNNGIYTYPEMIGPTKGLENVIICQRDNSSGEYVQDGGSNFRTLLSNEYTEIEKAWKDVYGESKGSYIDSDFYKIATRGAIILQDDPNLSPKYYDSTTQKLKKENWEQTFNEFDQVLDKLSENTRKIEEKESAASILKPIVQKWYYAFRNLAIVALLSILIYLGIKITLSAAVEDKVKYKKLIYNWLSAIVILFILHIIMSFTMGLIDEVNKMLTSSILSTENNEVPKDTLMTDIRTQAETEGEDKYRMSYAIIYIVLVIYTIKFSWIYIKRVIHLTFLTIIAPLVAVTYPLDKEKDGTSQAFDMWMREYFFNALLQPIHLILYVVIVDSAEALIDNNIIYVLVAIGFMPQAEKLIRKMFGMEKAGNASALSSFTEGAMMSSAMTALSHASSGNSSSGTNNNADTNEKLDNSGIKMAKLDDVFDTPVSDNENLSTQAGSNSGANIILNISGGKVSIDTPGISMPEGREAPSTGVDSSVIGGVTINAQNGNNSINVNDGNINLGNINTGASTAGIKMPSVQQLREMGMTPQEYIEAQERKIAEEQEKQRLAQEQARQAQIRAQQEEMQRRQEEQARRAQQNSNSKKKPKTKLSRTISGIGNVAGTATHKVFTPQNVVHGIRTVANLTAGAAGLTIGAAAGVASGKAENVIKYGSLGAAGMSGLANVATGVAEKTVGTSVELGKLTKDTYLKGYYDDDKEYQDKVAIPKLKEKNSKDHAIKEKYKRAGFDDWKQVMNSGIRDKLYHLGVVDEDTIIKAIKVQQKENIEDDELLQDVVVAANITTYKEAQTMEKELQQRLEARSGDKEQATIDARRRMKHIKAIAGL